MILSHAHNPWLVALSVLIAILASYTALNLAGRVTAARGRVRYAWLLGGAFAMGIGIWSMHFIAMLAFQLAVPVTYHLVTVLLSLLAAILASSLALLIVSRPGLGWLPFVLGGVVMGAAIATMHYTGMAAMRQRATLQYDPFFFILSIAIAIGASCAALWLAFRLRSTGSIRSQILKMLSAVVMGAAISGMHYTAMHAAIFTATNNFPIDPSGSIEVSQLGIAAITISTLLVLGLALLVSLIDQRQLRLTYPRKFALISLLFILPLTGFLPIVSAQVTRIDQYGYRELYGTFYLRAASQLVADVQSHELAVIDLRSGNVTRADVETIEARIDADFDALQSVHRQYSAPLQLTSEVDDLEARWQALKGGSLLPDESQGAYARFLADVQQLVSHVGDTSFLILDPDLNTYYMMDSVLLKLPENQSLLLQTAVLGEGILRRQAITADERTELITLTGRLEANLQAIETNIGVGLQNDAAGTMRPLVDPPLQAHSAGIRQLLAIASTDLIDAAVIESDKREGFLQRAKEAMGANSDFYQAASQALELGIRGRINNFTSQLVIAGAIAILGIGVAFITGLNLMLAISRPLVVLTEAAGRLATGHLTTRVPVTGADEAGQLSVAFNNMAQEIQTSQTALAARTRDLALAADVTRNISQVRNLDRLLDDAVELISSRFNLYYTQIYLADPASAALNMTAGTGIVGAELKHRRFRLPIGPGSINGTVAADKRPILVSDTARSAIFRSNPLLPGTRSEAAVPMLVGDRLLGVLDMQSAQPGTFTAENLPTFEILAGQLAVAIENVSLFDQVAKARAEVEEQVHRLTRSGWEEYLNAVNRSEQITSSYESEPPAGHEASASSTPNDSAAEIHMLSVPITVTGEPIGILRLESHTKSWTEDEAELVETVAKRVAQQIENIRLLEQADQYRHEAQEAARRLTRESWQEFLNLGDKTTAYVYDGTEVIPAPVANTFTGTDERGLARPIAVYGEPVGELAVEGVYVSNQEAVEILNSVAAQLSTHIENLRLNEQTKATLAETRTLYETSARLNAAQSLEEALHVAAAPAIAAGADNALLFVFDLDSNGNPEWMEVRANWAREKAVALPIGVRFYIPTYPLAQVWVHNPDAPAFIDDLQHDPRVDDRLRGVALLANMHAFVAMPMIIGGRWVGLIAITWTTPHRFAGGDPQLYRSLAAQAAAVIDNRLLFTQTQTALAESLHLYEASRRLAAAGTLQDVLATVVESVPIAAVSSALILAYQRDKTGNFNGALVSANWHGGYGTEPLPLGQYYPLDVFRAFKTLLSAEPAFFDDGQTDPRIESTTRDFLAQQHIRGLGILPLWVSGRQLGVMAIACEQPHHFTENEIRPYTSLAQQMAIAVENRRLFEQMQEALSESEELYRASTRLNAASTPEETLRAVAESVMTPETMAALLFSFVLDESGRPTSMITLAGIEFVGTGRPITELLGMQIPISDTNLQQLIEESKPSLIVDVAQDERFTQADRAFLWGARAMAAIPLRIGSRWIGFMTITWSAPRKFAEAEQRLFNSLAAQAATALDNQLLFRQTQKRAERESLINLIAQKIQSATSVEVAIQTAARELGQVFKARRAVVQLGSGEAPQNGK